MRVAAALGTALKKGAVVTVSRDTSRAARALKRAVIGGLNLAGINVEDIELATVPLTRFQVRNSGASAGVTVRLAPDDPDSIEIRFFDADGVDIDASMQRKIERLLYREDFRRAFAGDIGDIVFPPRSIEFYTAALERSVDARRLRERGLKIVLDYSYGAASIVMPSVLAKLGAEVLAVNPFASTVPRSLGDPEEQVAAHRVAGARVGERARLRARARRRAGHDHRRRGHVVASRSGAAGARACSLPSGYPGARIALPVSVTQEADASRSSTAPRSCGPSWPTPASRRSRPRRTSPSRRRPTAGSSGPTSCPPFDALATLAKLLDLLAGTGRRLSDVVRELPSGPHRPRVGADAVGAQGRGDARAGGAGAARSAGAHRRREDPPRRRVGARAARPRGAGDARVGRSRHRGRGPPGRPGVRPPHPPERSLTPLRFSPHGVPEHLKYSAEHEWVAVDGTRARIGITDFAQDALGDVVFVNLPAAGTAVVAAGTCAEVESTKSVSDIYAPVTGDDRRGERGPRRRARAA